MIKRGLSTSIQIKLRLQADIGLVGKLTGCHELS